MSENNSRIRLRISFLFLLHKNSFDEHGSLVMLSGVMLCKAAAGLGSPPTKYDSADIIHQLYFL